MSVLFLTLIILINEVMPAPSNAPEWVELYNAGSDPIDISHWYLDDDTPGGTQITIPADTVIAPATLYVITLNSAILNNTGDAITLYDTDKNLVDRIDFGAMKSNESLSRVPDGSSVVIKTPPSPGQFNDHAISPTAQPATTTPSATITADATEILPESTPTALIATPIPSESHTIAPTNTLSPSSTPSPTVTESAMQTSSPTKTPSDTRTSSPTKTPSITRTPSPTKTPSITRTPSPTKTPSVSKTPSNTSLVSATRTLSPTRTASATKTMSRTRTPRPSKTLPITRSPKSSQTPSPTRTPRLTRTPISGASPNNPRASDKASVTPPIIAITGKAHTPQLMICPPPPSTLSHWMLTADSHHIALPDSSDCVTVDLPANPPAHWQLNNPHGLVVATIDVFAAYCAHDISDCQPSPTMAQMALHVEYQRPQTTPRRRTATIAPTDAGAVMPIEAHSNPAPNTTPSTIPLGMLLMLGGWIALKLLARPTPDVLYSEADEDAASSADSLSSESRKV